MRALLAAFLFARVVCAGEPVDYPVRDMDLESEKFAKVFRAALEEYHNLQRAAVQECKLKISQNVDGDLYLVSDTEKDYALRLPGKLLADATWVTLAVVLTEEVYQFTTVLGATRTVGVLKMAPEVKSWSMAEFVRILKGGGDIVVTMGWENVRCQKCGGFGRVTATSDRRRGADGKENCPACGGRSFFKDPKRFRIKW